MNTAENQIPSGYMQDAQGRLIPEANVRPIDKERDSLVRHIVKAAKEHHSKLSEFKLNALGDIDALVDIAGEEYGVKLGGAKGNLQLTSYDGRYKVRRDKTEHLTFDEGLQAAKALIDECINDWAKGSNENLHVLINDAFSVNQEGKLDIRRILTLQRYDIDDPRWKKAMEAIKDSLQVIGSSTYLRIYERQQDGSYKQISLDLAGV